MQNHSATVCLKSAAFLNCNKPPLTQCFTFRCCKLTLLLRPCPRWGSAEPRLSTSIGLVSTTTTGLVFLQYRNETRRALLPNEITSMDTVKALFVRSFPRQLSMEYLDSAIIRIYIHDPGRDMFYELEGMFFTSITYITI